MACPEDKILNPATGRCVSKKGKIGKELLKKIGAKKIPSSSFSIYPVESYSIHNSLNNSGCSPVGEPLWNLGAPIGESGAFGEIHLGCCMSHCDYIMKFIPFARMPKEAIEREIFIQTVSSKLGSSLPVEDYWFTSQGAVIVMRLLKETLKSYLETCDATECKNIIDKVLEKIRALHIRVFHNDLHANNIMIDHDGEVYIIDYGLSKSYPKRKGVPDEEKYSDYIKLIGSLQTISMNGKERTIKTVMNEAKLFR